MSVKISSGALALVSRALQLAGVRAQTTHLEDGAVDQVLEISQLVSSSFPGNLDKGAFYIQADQAHGGAGALIDVVPIYAPTTTLNFTPDELSRLASGDFDVWILSYAVSCTAPANITDAVWFAPISNVTPQVTDGSTGALDVPLAFTTSFTALAGFEDIGFPTYFTGFPFRLPRTWDGLTFLSNATGATGCRHHCLAELVPVGMRPSGF